jgi:hypothetical protein
MIRRCAFVLSVTLCLLLVAKATAADESISKDAVAKARKQLDNRSRAEGTLFFIYPTTTLLSYNEYESVRTVKGADGKVRPGWFCLSVRYKWKGILENGHTDLVYFFNPSGKLSEIVVEADTAATGKPFEDVDTILKLIKKDLEKKLGEIKDAVLRDLLANAVRKSDAKAILTVLLMLDQD